VGRGAALHPGWRKKAFPEVTPQGIVAGNGWSENGCQYVDNDDNASDQGQAVLGQFAREIAQIPA
jgi:hypothetical protein